MNANLIRAGATAFLLALPLSRALAIAPVQICVTNQSSDWMLAPANGGPCGTADPLLPATFSLPEPVSETTLEQVGDFTFNVPFTTPQGYYTIKENATIISDYILFGNTAPGGNGEVFFYSDMTPRMLIGSNYGVLCMEGDAGCEGGFSIGTASGSISVLAASDSETRPFDPFGLGADYSDAVSFSDPAPTPEPTQLPAALAMLALAFYVRRLANTKGKA